MTSVLHTELGNLIGINSWPCSRRMRLMMLLTLIILKTTSWVAHWAGQVDWYNVFDQSQDVANIDVIEDNLLSCLFLTLGDIGGQALPCWDLSAPDFIQETIVVIIIDMIILIFEDLHLLVLLFSHCCFGSTKGIERHLETLLQGFLSISIAKRLRSSSVMVLRDKGGNDKW